MRWQNPNTKSFLKLFGALAVSLIAVAVVMSYFECGGNIGHPAQAAPQEPRVVKIKEVIGQVVGGPQIVSGNPLIGYAVYIEETKTWGALHVDGCPPDLGSGMRIIMYQGSQMSKWYKFLRYAP